MSAHPSAIYFQGNKLPLEIAHHPEKRSHLKISQDLALISLCENLNSHQQKQQILILIEKLYRRSTKRMAEKTLQVLLAHHPTKKVNRITIKKIRTRWGSCSANGNLNFNLDLAKLPPEVQQYIVIHEFSHLFQMNHSAKFWIIVQSLDPLFKEHRRMLRQYEKLFHHTLS